MSSGRGQKKAVRLSAGDRREQLLDVTTAMVVDQGFGAVTIEGVARAAGITRPIIYQHFGDLSGLLHAVVKREMTRAASQVTETTLADLSQGPPVELMIESLSSYLNAVRSHPTTWRLALMPPDGAPEILRAAIEAGRDEMRRRMIRSVRPLLEAADESSDPELTARMLSALADEYARLVLQQPDRYPPERLLGHARWMLELVHVPGAATAGSGSNLLREESASRAGGTETRRKES